MRILFISNLYPPNGIGGYEELAFSVASEFAARGHDVHVLTSDFGASAPQISGQTVRRELRLLTGDTIYDPFPGSAEEREAVGKQNNDALLSAVERERPDLVFSWNLFFFHPSMLGVLERLPVPVAVMLTDNWLINMTTPEWWQAYFATEVMGAGSKEPMPLPAVSSRLRQRARAFVQRLSRNLNRSRSPLPPSAMQPRTLTAIFGSRYMHELHRKAGLHFSREETIHNGVRALRPAIGVDANGTPVRSPEGPVKLLFAGRLVDLKGAHRCVEALTLLRRDRPDLPPMTLTVLGDQRDRAYSKFFAEVVRDSGCADRIEVLPPVPEHELMGVFAAHDIYLFPSLYEPFSLTLIHALSAGIPTIASDAGGNAEIVMHGSTGLLYPRGSSEALADRIATLVESPALRSRLAEGGRDAARKFTFTAMVDRMEKLLEDIR